MKLYRADVAYTYDGDSGMRREYVHAPDVDTAAREAEANAYEEMPGADVFADPDLIEEVQT